MATWFVFDRLNRPSARPGVRYTVHAAGGPDGHSLCGVAHLTSGRAREATAEDLAKLTRCGVCMALEFKRDVLGRR